MTDRENSNGIVNTGQRTRILRNNGVNPNYVASTIGRSDDVYQGTANTNSDRAGFINRRRGLSAFRRTRKTQISPKGNANG